MLFLSLNLILPQFFVISSIHLSLYHFSLSSFLSSITIFFPPLLLLPSIPSSKAILYPSLSLYLTIHPCLPSSTQPSLFTDLLFPDVLIIIIPALYCNLNLSMCWLILSFSSLVYLPSSSFVTFQLAGGRTQVWAHAPWASQ